MKYPAGTKLKVGDRVITVFGVSRPWNDPNQDEQYMIGEGEKFLPGFLSGWIPIEELDAREDLEVVDA
ncbi:MAG: hypothetical protein ACWGQW_06700 [bacterium]